MKNEARAAARRLLNMTIPDNMLETLKEEYGLLLPKGAIYLDALLFTKILQMAAAGDKEAQKRAKEYGLAMYNGIQEEVGLT